MILSNGTNSISLDVSDFNAMKMLMEVSEKESQLLRGVNSKGEIVVATIMPDKIFVETKQTNSYIRRNIYHKNGEEEETFCGKWYY